MPYLSGLTIHDVAFTPTTRTDMVDKIKTEMVTAGWTSISGSSGDWLLESGVTPAPAYQFRVRVWDPGSGNCMRIGIRNVANTINLESQPIFLFPQSDEFRLIGSARQIHIYKPGDVTNSRKACQFGVPFQENLTSVDTLVAWYIGDSASDTGTLGGSYRTQLGAHTGGGTSGPGVFGWIVNSNGVSSINTGTASDNGRIRLVLPWDVHNINDVPPRLANSNWAVANPLFRCGESSISDNGKIRGGLWDVIAVGGSSSDFADGETISWAGENWRIIGGMNHAMYKLAHLLPPTSP